MRSAIFSHTRVFITACSFILSSPFGYTGQIAGLSDFVDIDVPASLLPSHLSKGLSQLARGYRDNNQGKIDKGLNTLAEYLETDKTESPVHAFAQGHLMLAALAKASAEAEIVLDKVLDKMWYIGAKYGFTQFLEHLGENLADYPAKGSIITFYQRYFMAEPWLLDRFPAWRQYYDKTEGFYENLINAQSNLQENAVTEITQAQGNKVSLMTALFPLDQQFAQDSTVIARTAALFKAEFSATQEFLKDLQTQLEGSVLGIKRSELSSVIKQMQQHLVATGQMWTKWQSTNELPSAEAALYAINPSDEIKQNLVQRSLNKGEDWAFQATKEKLWQLVESKSQDKNIVDEMVYLRTQLFLMPSEKAKAILWDESINAAIIGERHKETIHYFTKFYANRSPEKLAKRIDAILEQYHLTETQIATTIANPESIATFLNTMRSSHALSQYGQAVLEEWAMFQGKQGQIAVQSVLLYLSDPVNKDIAWLEKTLRISPAAIMPDANLVTPKAVAVIAPVVTPAVPKEVTQHFVRNLGSVLGKLGNR